jgi:cyclase
LDLFTWAKRAEELGAGEILFTSMDNDGVHGGYATQTLAALSDMLTIPTIASGGAGRMSDFYDVFADGKADAALAAGVFHFGEIQIPHLKHYLAGRGILMRG